MTPFAGFENRLVLNGFSADENGIGYKLIGRLPGVGFGSSPEIVGELARLAALPFHTTTSDQVLETKIKTFSLSNVRELELGGGMTLKNIFGYRYVDRLEEHTSELQS